jgi:type I restriction enzyme, S subunit
MSSLRAINWQEKRLKYVASYNDEVLSETTDEFAELDYVEIADVSLSGGVERSTRLQFHEAPSRARRKVRDGDVLISTVRTYLKAIASVPHATENMIASTGFCIVRPGETVDSAFIGWTAKSDRFVHEVVSRSVGVSYPAINASEIGNIDIPLPPLETQKRIAAFLDEKTARIDALIARKRALLGHLAEKRQALITRAVTKGLNPAAPLKDSGIDWLGQIPAHWVVMPIKRIKRFLTSGSRGWGDYYADEGDMFLRMTNVTKGGVEIDTTDLRFVNLEGVNEGTRTATQVGDILITITAELGSVAIVREAHVGAYINQHLALFRCDQSRCDPNYLVSFLSSEVTKAQFQLSGQGGTKQGLGFDQVDGVMIGLPPLDEQIQIAQHVEITQAEINKIELEVSNSIARLTEFRAALITSAVTGQLEGLQ